VICALGIKNEHIEEETLTILIWTFSMLAVLASFLIGNNWEIYHACSRRCRKLCRRGEKVVSDEDASHGHHGDRNIILLGFHKIAAMFIAHLEHHNPRLLEKIHVIDFHETVMAELKKRGVTCAYGDISSPDVLEHAHHGECRLVIVSIPDSMLKGMNNKRLLQVAKQVWPSADVIVSADTPMQARELYEAGADYVLRLSKICAERLGELILEHSMQLTHHHQAGQEQHLSRAFHTARQSDREESGEDESSIAVK